MIKTLFISEDHYDEMIRFSESQLPKECCVLLLGHTTMDVAETKNLYLAHTPDSSSAHFYFDNESLLRAYLQADTLGMEIVGIFHSHPYWPPSPSTTDHTYMKTNRVPWLIYSNSQKVMKTYGLDDKDSIVDVNVIQLHSRDLSGYPPLSPRRD